MTVILATSEAKIERLTMPGQPGQTVGETISNITRAEWTGGIAHTVEHPLCKAQNHEFKPQFAK
jgi:hypothetical protein